MTYIRALIFLLLVGAPAHAESEAEKFIRDGGILRVSIGVICEDPNDMVAIMQERYININEQMLSDGKCWVIRKSIIQRIEAIRPFTAVDKKRYCLTHVAVHEEKRLYDAHAAMPYVPTQPCGENG